MEFNKLTYLSIKATHGPSVLWLFNSCQNHSVSSQPYTYPPKKGRGLNQNLASLRGYPFVITQPLFIDDVASKFPPQKNYPTIIFFSSFFSAIGRICKNTPTKNTSQNVYSPNATEQTSEQRNGTSDLETLVDLFVDFKGEAFSGEEGIPRVTPSHPRGVQFSRWMFPKIVGFTHQNGW